MIKKLLLLAFSAFALAACTEDNEQPLGPVGPGPGPEQKPVTGITLDRTDAALAPGETLQLVVTVEPADADDPVFDWKSDNSDLATVTDKGLVTAVGVGKTTIRVVCHGFKASCEVTVAEPEEPVDPVLSETISFELGEGMTGIDGEATALRTITVVSGKNSAQFSNVYWAKEYTWANDDMLDKYGQRYFAMPLFSTAGSDTWFSSYYCDCTTYGAQYDAWGGFILSSNVNKTTQAGQDNQFEAYTDGGANGSATFAVCYDAKTAGMAMSADCCWPQIDFTSGVRKPLSVTLANSTWTYNHFKGNNGDRYAVKITGLKEGVETGSVECVLIDGAMKVDAWKTFDLSALGEVDCLTMFVVSSQPYAPFYFCVDDIVLEKL